MHWILRRTQFFFLRCLKNARPHHECIAVALRFNIATTPSLQDGIAKEFSEAGLLAHGEQREPRLPSYEDMDKLPYLTAVSTPFCDILPSPQFPIYIDNSYMGYKTHQKE